MPTIPVISTRTPPPAWTALVRVRNRLADLGGAVTLAGATPIVQRVLEVSGLVEVIGTFPSVEAARAAAGHPSAHAPVVDDSRRAGLVE